MTEYDQIRRAMREQGFSHAKGLGQNFLWDPALLRAICAHAEAGEHPVVEIGPGVGTLTRMLSQTAPQVLAVEIDERLRPILDVSLEGCDNVRVAFGDALKIDLNARASEVFGEGVRWACIANLPYYITTPVLLRLLESKWPIARITVMVQREVAERIVAAPATKEYGALSVAVQYRASASIVMNVPSGAFSPPPNVESCVVRMDVYDRKPVQPNDEALFIRVARGAFAMRRKTMANNLVSALGITRDQAASALVACGLDERVRGETLGVAQLAALSDVLGASGAGQTRP